MESELLHDRTSDDSIQSNSVMAQYDYGSEFHPYLRVRVPAAGACRARAAAQASADASGAALARRTRDGSSVAYIGADVSVLSRPTRGSRCRR